MVNFKDQLKRNGFAYNIVSGVKAQILETKYRKEVLSYHQRAGKLGLAYSETLITQRLNEQLRHYNIQPKVKGDLHIFAAVYNANWERHSLFPQLKKFEKVTWYDWRNRGFDHSTRNWVSKERQAMNQDLLRSVKLAHQENTIDIFFGYISNWSTMHSKISEIGSMSIPIMNLCLDDKPFFDSFNKESGLAQHF